MTSPDALDVVATIMQDLPVGLWVARAPGGEHVFANKMFGEIMGTNPRRDAAAGHYAEPYGIHDQSGARYPEERLPFPRVLREREIVLVDDIVIHRPDGVRRNVRARAAPMFDVAGEIQYVVVTFTDVTREVELERERQENEQRVRHAQKMESIGNLAGGVAHDFNNLLASIRMLVSLMQAGETDSEKLANLTRLEQTADSAVSLTRSLLGFARRGKNLAQQVKLDTVAGSVAELLRRTIDPRIELEVTLGADAGAIVGDTSQIEQVLMNLALNARDAMPVGGTLHIRTALVTVDAAMAAAHPPLAAGRHLVLEVADTGVGIDPAIRDRIFEPYFTTKTSGPVRGTGLGLATVYGIVASHHGSIEVLDAKPRGTIMRILFPAATPSVSVTDQPARRAELRRGEGLILLVEDEALVRESTSRALSFLGYRVVEAADGVAGLEIFRERHAEFAAVMLDFMMPRMNGRDTCMAMREIDAKVPVLLTTGYALDGEAQRILDAGVEGFLPKPFDVRALSELLGTVARRVTALLPL